MNWDEVEQIKKALRRWHRRLRLQQWVRWTPWGLLAGLVSGLLVLIAARVWPLWPTPTLGRVAAGLAVLGLIVVAVLALGWRRSAIALARRFDLVLGLRERTSTALELTEGIQPVENTDLARAQIQQAAESIQQVDVKAAMPVPFPNREWGAAILLLVVVFVALVWPNPQDRVLAAQAEFEETLTEEIEELEELVREVESSETLTPDEAEQILEVLEDTIETLEQDDIEVPEAVAAMEAAEQELNDLSEQFAEQRQDALTDLGSMFDGTAAQELADALESGDAEAVAEALENLDLDSLSAEELAELADALNEASEAAEGSNPELSEQLGEAAEAIASGDLAGAEEALGEAAESAGEAGAPTVAEVDEYAEDISKGEAAVAGRGPGQPGQGTMGQVQPGEGQGSGEQEGQGGSGGAGRGEGEGEAQGGQAGDDMSTDNGAGDGGETDFEELFAPQRVGGEGGDQVDIPGNPDPGLPTGVEGDFVENPDGNSTVPYNEVYGDYAGQANEALDSGYVPLGLRDLVRDYFSSLDPANSD